MNRTVVLAGLGTAALLVALAAAPLYLPSYPLFVLSLGLVYTVAVLGVNLVMGCAGLVSLGHAGFAAVGAYVAAIAMTKLGLSFWIALPLGGLAAAACGVVLGLPSLRLGPLHVAMVTFGFSWVIVLIAQNWLDVTNGPNGLAVPPPRAFGRDLYAPDFHLAVVAITVVLFALARNLLASVHGRAFMAIRESELAAQAMGVNLAFYKTLAFALGALYAGLSGALFAGLTHFVNPDAFHFGVSILYVTVAILGGLGYLAGSALGGLLMAVMPEFLRGTGEFKDLLTGSLLLALLIFLPHGLAGFADRRGWLPRRPAPPAIATTAPQAARDTVRAASATGDAPLLEVDRLTVRFGGLTALKDVSLAVNPGEIVGLIGPNGAGKTTLFNAVTGLYRASGGAVLLEGRDLGRVAAHERTRLGLARTFQSPELFHDLTVLENVLVGAHTRQWPGLVASTLATPRTRVTEAGERTRARELAAFTGLAQWVDRRAESLSFGHQRMLEIARALAAQPKLLLLDEPAAGLTSAEAEFLMVLIRRIRAELGVAVLLIGHTMRVVMGLSDRIVVLDHGERIAEGSPAAVRANADVIRAYLGTQHA
ncbi:MAG TPA: branched-chain amino acid ABC transporter ATP-binding protein/permease [Burkholderiales bacterium]|nr:branched-chain amino acid ABC transporter ATP-binding protein/permease [Burkholderiales bacterium]